MAISLKDTYPGSRITPPDANYSQGSVKNETTPGVSNDGTPLDEAWGNDEEGYKQAVMAEAGLAFSNNPDTEIDSQILEAQKRVLRSGRKNLVLNSIFNINERSVSGSVVLAANEYGHDRWRAGASGCSYTFSKLNGVTTITISAGSLQQVIEGDNFESGAFVLSWEGTAQGQISSGGYGDSGEVKSTLTGGSNASVEFNSGTVSKVQLEKGSISTKYEHLFIPEDKELCRYYFERVNTGQSENPWGYSFSPRTTTNAVGSIAISPKRATPTVSISGTIKLQTGVNAPQSVTSILARGNSGVVSLVTAGGLVASTIHHLVTGSGSYIDFDSEI